VDVDLFPAARWTEEHDKAHRRSLRLVCEKRLNIGTEQNTSIIETLILKSILKESGVRNELVRDTVGVVTCCVPVLLAEICYQMKVVVFHKYCHFASFEVFAAV